MTSLQLADRPARARTDHAKEDRRQILLAAALDEFFDRGFAAARMDDIARRAGVSKGALYLYFPSKEAMFQALVETYAVPNDEQVEALVAGAGSGRQALAALAQFAPLAIRATPLPRIVKVLVGDARAFPQLLASYRALVIDRALGALARLIEIGQQRGEFAPGDPAMLARLVAAPILFAALWVVMFEESPEARLDIEALMATHVGLLERALRSD